METSPFQFAAREPDRGPDIEKQPGGTRLLKRPETPHFAVDSHDVVVADRYDEEPRRMSIDGENAQAGVSSIRLSCRRNDATRMFRQGSGRRDVETPQKLPQIRSLAPGDVIPAREQAGGRRHVLQEWHVTDREVPRPFNTLSGFGVDRCVKHYMDQPSPEEQFSAARRRFPCNGTTSYRMQLLLTPKPPPPARSASESARRPWTDPIEECMLSPPTNITYCRKKTFSEKGVSSSCFNNTPEQGEPPIYKFPADCARSTYNKPTDIFGINYSIPRSRRPGGSHRCHLTASHMGMQPNDESLPRCSDVNPKFLSRRRPQMSRFSSVFKSDLVPVAPNETTATVGFPGTEGEGKESYPGERDILGQPQPVPRYPGQYRRVAPLRGKRHFEVPWNSDTVLLADARLVDNN